MNNKIELGLIGLGKMGANMAQKMLESNKVNLHAYDINEDARKKVGELGACTKSSIEELVEGLWQDRKVVWLMLPAGKITEDTFQQVINLLRPNDIIIDGGNSNFNDTLRRAQIAKEKNISFLDAGVSGGLTGVKNGYPMMIGGDEEVYRFVEPIFESFGYPNGFGLVGPTGAGHYVKMIHNAVEYGMMQSIAEGFDLLDNGRFQHLDKKNVARIWDNGCIVSSFLMTMTRQALENNEELSQIEPCIEDNGEGKWSSIEALNYGVPFVANTYALNVRYQSRDKDSYQQKLISGMRYQFGGHEFKHKK